MINQGTPATRPPETRHPLQILIAVENCIKTVHNHNEGPLNRYLPTKAVDTERWAARFLFENLDGLAQTRGGDDATQDEAQAKQREPVVRIEEHPGVVEEDDQHADGEKAEHQV